MSSLKLGTENLGNLQGKYFIMFLSIMVAFSIVSLVHFLNFLIRLIKMETIKDRSLLESIETLIFAF